MLQIFCRNISINKPELLKSNGPLLIALNHPNSFLDAIIIATLFKQPVYSLARGDVFKNRFISKLLNSLNIFPVYRMSEGAENLSQNYTTFDECKKIFKNNGIVLIFSEGKCINEWHLRPLKKGTARLALNAWKENIPLKILPGGINYNSFSRFGKNVKLNFGEFICKENIEFHNEEGRNISLFNCRLKNELQQLVIEVDKNDKERINQIFSITQPKIKKILLFIPFVFGWILHAPIYYPIKKIAWNKTSHNDHFDSILLCSLVFVYPFYLLATGLLLFWIMGGWWWLGVFLILPFCAWSCTQLKS